MTTTKINCEVSLSKNFNKVTLGMVDEPIEHKDDDELETGIQRRLNFLAALCKEKLGEI
jgi:hypothetical protein